MKNKKLKYEELEKKLAEAEKLIARLEKSRTTAISSKPDGAIKDTQELAQAYIASEQNFKNSMDASPLGIRIVTEDGALIYANKAILDICGYNTPQELAAVPRSQLYTPESYQAHLERKRKRKLKEYVPLEYEISIRRPDGEVRNLQVYRREVMWGGEQQFMGMYQDITEHKRAEQALRESEEKFHSIVEHSNDGIVFIQDGMIQYCNSKMLEIGSYTQRDVLGKAFIDFVAPEHKEMVLDIYNKRIAGKKTRERYELNMVGKGGRKVYSEVSASLVNFKQNQVDIAIVRDISERKKVEEVLADESTRRRILIEQSRDGIVVLDQDGNVYEVNQRFADMVGYSLEEAHKLHVFDWEFLYTKERVVEMIRTVDEKGDHFETQHRRKDGTIYDVEISTNGAMFAGQKLIFCVCRDITERKRAEKVIHESEERFRTLFETMAQGVIYHDGEGRVISANPAAQRILGLTLDEMIGKTSPDPHRKRLHEDGSTFTSEEHPPIVALRTGKPVNNVIMAIYNPAEEDYRWIINSAIPEFREGEKKPYRVYTTFADITERKRMEQALRESEEKFSKAFVSSPAIVAITTMKDGKYVDINDSYTQTTGYSREELIGKTSMSLNIWANEQDRIRMFRLLNEQGRISKEEFGFRMKSGETRTWLFSAEPISFGGEECLIGVSVDITERKQAEQRINYLNLTLRSIRNVNQLITREKDRDKLLQGICDAFTQTRSFYMAWIVLFDESRHLITYAQSGMHNDFSPVVEAIKQGNLPSCVEKALKNKQVVIIEDPGKCTGCQMYEKSLDYGSMSVRLEYDGNVYGVLCGSLPREMLTDIDEPNLFEEVASDIAFALYNMERESDYRRLEQERLRAAKLESIGTLAGGIAHDFNNLLTGIMGNIGLVKTNISPSDASYEMLDEAEKAALRAKDLTQQLLTFARGGKPVKKSVNIAEIIRESAAFALRGSKAREELSLPDDLWTIDADEGQISQVINNLVINADEAMPARGTLKIQAKNSTLKKTDIPLLPSGDYIRIDIADTGIGISPEHLQRIFEPYFTTKQRGSGLGLTTAYSIVRNHGGTILADSIQNKGSTFHIYLPATKKTMKGGKKMKSVSSGQAGGKVLVMDDEEIIRKMLNNMLSLAGYTVELSADGAEALKKYQQAKKAGDPFNAVIMDLTIPGGMGGKEAVQKLLEIDPQAKVIVSSGYATDPIMSEFKKYGFKAVIAKPYSVKQLQETLSGLLTVKKK
ncbi:MAG: PAS domain S-box protein [Dehalococcoidales bacterium]